MELARKTVDLAAQGNTKALEALVAWWKWNDPNGEWDDDFYLCYREIAARTIEYFNAEDLLWEEQIIKQRILVARDRFRNAAKELADLADQHGEEWNAMLCDNYPESWGSFDEVALEIALWQRDKP